VSGYAGGTDPNPTYEKVCTQATGHAETVQVNYYPSQISFKQLVEAFLQVKIQQRLIAKEMMKARNTVQ